MRASSLLGSIRSSYCALDDPAVAVKFRSDAQLPCLAALVSSAVLVSSTGQEEGKSEVGFVQRLNRAQNRCQSGCLEKGFLVCVYSLSLNLHFLSTEVVSVQNVA